MYTNILNLKLVFDARDSSELYYIALFGRLDICITNAFLCDFVFGQKMESDRYPSFDF